LEIWKYNVVFLLQYNLYRKKYEKYNKLEYVIIPIKGPLATT